MVYITGFWATISKVSTLDNTGVFAGWAVFWYFYSLSYEKY